MKFELFKRVALAVDVPEHGLVVGDIATVVDYLTSENTGEPGYALEVFNAIGETIDVLMVSESSLKPIHADMIPCVRKWARGPASLDL